MINNDWDEKLLSEYQKAYFRELIQFVNRSYLEKEITPPADRIFRALQKTPFSQVRVVILGQDPYPEKGVATGLAFATNQEKKPRSLVNIEKALYYDLGRKIKNNNLDYWAEQGVLLLNTVLTNEIGQINAHRYIGWERFTDAIIKVISEEKEKVIFLLLGKQAQEKKQLIKKKHIIIEASHPSPQGAYRGFLQSKVFSQINNNLEQKIDW